MRFPAPLSILVLLAVLTAGRAEIWSTPETLWQNAAEASPLRPRPRFNLGQVAMANGQYVTALENYQQAEVLSMRPEIPPADREMAALLVGMNIVDALIRAGQVEEAHQVLKQAWMAHPGFPGYAVNLSWFYLKVAHEPQKAIVILASGIDHFEEYRWFQRKGSLYVHLGVALQMTGQCEEAKEAFMVARYYQEQFTEQSCT